MGSERVVVCAFALGAPRYVAALGETVRSALRHTPFEVVALLDPGAATRLPRSPRLRRLPLAALPGAHRSRHFLAKFRALQDCLAHSDAELVLYLDADAVFTRSVAAAEVAAALAGRGLGMVEQTPPPGAGYGRERFHDHYCRHTHRWFGAPGDPPPFAAFRYFNSGVVLARRAPLGALCEWALQSVTQRGPQHEVGAHMIADQDYFQYWAHALHPDSATALDWSWNHCAHWHGDFPRPGARIAHLSNACQGPTRRTIWRLRALRTTPAIERTWRRAQRAIDRQAADGPTAATLPSAPGVAPAAAAAVDLQIIIVAHQSATALARCLADLPRPYRARCLVVDNASTDGSAAVAERHGARVLAQAHNLGFARAANLGAAAATASHLCFLNPDCRPGAAVFEAALARLRAVPERCLVADLDEPGSATVAGRQPGYSAAKLLHDALVSNYRAGRLAAVLARRASFHDRRWHWPHGACFFIERRQFLALGGFDPRYFLYMEDVDFGLRLHAAGGVVETLAAQVPHAARSGARVSPTWRLWHLNAARVRYAAARHGVGLAIGTALVGAPGLVAHAARELWSRRRAPPAGAVE